MPTVPLVSACRTIGFIPVSDISRLQKAYGHRFITKTSRSGKTIKSVEILPADFRTATVSSWMPGGSKQSVLTNLGNGLLAWELVNDRTSQACRGRESLA